MRHSKYTKEPRLGRLKDANLAARRRGEIVRHAINQFASNGYAGTNLDAIAADAGCAKGTVYLYFVSKRDLFCASVDHVMFSMVERVGITEKGDPLDQL